VIAALAMAGLVMVLVVGCASSGTGTAGYAEAFEAINGRFLHSVEKFDLLTAQAEADPSLREDPHWRVELIACFTVWGETADELRAQQVPEQYREAHVNWLTGADHYTRAGELMRAALDSPTVELSDEIAAELSLGQEIFGMVEAIMEEAQQ
jgi:hypothetical protein